ncbi:MAG: hypothetical protein DWQ44_04085 [Bacteroidetes bacterium]|nr:MAG: hypothetical protein DWQ33_13900 [Bacteroidota bacterium]REK00368.1 MAG: hypothetical protein DWQ39_11980 [Bacteroidota bacterium]REK35487.1 MAG: hypothetical protein DWQ44_04085 [Bacteroidota bacterium]REK46829.1 MAG: hypothetical protein DWQ48_13805 [Bacteroidota bacterium]
MPLVYKHIEANYSLGIWESLEKTEELREKVILSQVEENLWLQFRSEHRKREWLAVRLLFRNLSDQFQTEQIRYESSGKPVLSMGHSISISHTGNYVAVLISETPSAGIDLEALRPGIVNLAGKFVSQEESLHVPEKRKVEHLHVLWGAKEVLYKLYSHGGIDFRLDLKTDPFIYNEKGAIHAAIEKQNFRQNYLVNYMRWNDCMLTWSIGA